MLKPILTTVCAAFLLTRPVGAQSLLSGWTETKPIPEPAYFARAVSYNGHLLVFKFWTAPLRVWVGDTAADGQVVAWRETLAPPLPEGALNFKSVGRVGRYVVIPDAGQSLIGELAADGSILAWRSGPGTTNPAPYQRAIAIDGDRIFSIAGSQPYAVLANVDTATIDANGNLSAWTSLNPLPAGLLDPMAAVIDRNLYVFGGSTGDPFDLSGASMVRRAPILADGSIGAWADAGALREARPHSGFLADGDTLHILPAGVHSYGTVQVESVLRTQLGNTAQHVYSQAFPQFQIQGAYTEWGGYGYLIGGVTAAYGTAWTNKAWVVPLPSSVDRTPPVITVAGPLAGACTLWPPNGKMVSAGVVSASDLRSQISTLSVVVTSTDPSMTPETDVSVVGGASGPLEVKLRAKRPGNGDGRVYEMTITATDSAGNLATTHARCTVPHDQGAK